MIEKLLQCLRLLGLVLACYGWLRFWMRRFRLPVELALPVSLCALGLTLFAGMAFLYYACDLRSIGKRLKQKRESI